MSLLQLQVGLLQVGVSQLFAIWKAANHFSHLPTRDMANVVSFFFALLLADAALSSSTQADGQLQGKMETRDGSMCVWFELRKSGRGNVFVTACHCKDAEGHRHSYSCEFDGPMQECQEYQTSPKEFYNMVATTLQSIQ